MRAVLASAVSKPYYTDSASLGCCCCCCGCYSTRSWWWWSQLFTCHIRDCHRACLANVPGVELRRAGLSDDGVTGSFRRTVPSASRRVNSSIIRLVTAQWVDTFACDVIVIVYVIVALAGRIKNCQIRIALIFRKYVWATVYRYTGISRRQFFSTNFSHEGHDRKKTY